MSDSPIRICIILGTRPEAIKLAPVIRFISGRFSVSHRSGTGREQHREMVDQVMALFALKADADLAIMQPKQTLKRHYLP